MLARSKPVRENYFFFEKGEEIEIKQIYLDARPGLMNYALRRGFSSEDSEDLVSYAFVQLICHKKKFYSEEHIRRWLYITLRNKLIDASLLKSKLHEYQRETMSGTDSSSSPAMEAAYQVRWQKVMEAIDKLSDRRKAILRLIFFEGKKTREIVGILNISEQTVLNHKAKAIQLLRKNRALQEFKPDLFRSGIDGFTNRFYL